MTTSQATSFLSEILNGEPIPIGKLAYFRARLSNRIHELVLAEFVRLERERKINKAELARRLGRKPEQVTRWLGAAGNWTIETLSDLMLGMGCEPALSVTSLNDANQYQGISAQIPKIGYEWQCAEPLASYRSSDAPGEPQSGFALGAVPILKNLQHQSRPVLV